MKLMIPLVDGANLTFEGTYDELVQVAEDFVKKHAATIAVSGTASAAQQGTQPRVNGSRRWTEQSARRLLGLLYGEQEKVVRFLVEHGGAATYGELKQHLGYDGQRLSGILSPITRNAQTATGDRLARLVDWRVRKDGEREYYIDAEALPFL
jgi:hypothetical protein